MTKIYTKLLLTAFSLLFLVSCQNDDAPPEPKSNVLFSVDFKNDRFSSDRKSYIAAYTADGKLLNYGSLSDSAKWSLKAKYDGNKIDILYFEVFSGNTLSLHHIRNIAVGQSFTEPATAQPYYPNTEDFKGYNIKVKDFANYPQNSTAEFLYMSVPYIRKPGYAYWGDFSWTKIEDGYTYQKVLIDKSTNPNYTEQGFALVLFERGTNSPYIKYVDVTNKNPADLITLNKSDFTAAKTNLVQINAKSNEFTNTFLYTYNSKTSRPDMIVSFNHVSEKGNKTWYVSSEDLLPMSYWKFSYFAKEKNTSYTINSNKKEIPSVIDIKDLTGQVVTKNGSEYTLTHAAIFPDKKLVRSYAAFTKRNAATFYYSYYFDANESTGTTKLNPFKIPAEVLKKYDGFIDTDNSDWKTESYGQVYTNISNNSSLDYFRSTVLLGIDNNKSSSGEYIYETFSIPF